MVDVSVKAPTQRRAVARATISMAEETAEAISRGVVSKGDVLAVARVAGIMAAKKTGDLIPLCHPLAVTAATVDFDVRQDSVVVEVVVNSVGPTGVEMEALLAASTAALCVYDMCKASDRAMRVTDVSLWEKSGGKSGLWRRDEA